MDKKTKKMVPKMRTLPCQGCDSSFNIPDTQEILFIEWYCLKCGGSNRQEFKNAFPKPILDAKYLKKVRDASPGDPPPPGGPFS